MHPLPAIVNLFSIFLEFPHNLREIKKLKEGRIQILNKINESDR